MISILFGTGGENPVEETGKDEHDPAECGYDLVKTVDWPATDPSTIKGRFFTGNYPADPYLESDDGMESEEHEASESKDEEEKEHY